MKKKRLIIIMPFFLMAVFIGIYSLNGCQKDVETIESNAPYIIKGKVVDKKTLLPISGVTIICLDKSVKTNSDGIYSLYFKKLPDDFIKIQAKKEGYPVGTTIITGENYYSVNTIKLIPPSVIKAIGSSGGSISFGNSESIDASQKIEVVFPEGALNNSINISITPLEGIAVPDISPKTTLGLLNAATVCLEPSGLKLNKNATISFPLPMKMDVGTTLDLLIYNEDSLIWKESGITATVDATGSRAAAEISHFSTYSIGIEGSYIETIDDSKLLTNSKALSSNQDEYCYQATVEYPNGVPNTVSLNWLKNIVSQNTELCGRVSFLDETCININYNKSSIQQVKQNKYFAQSKSLNLTCDCPDPGSQPECMICDLVSYTYICEVQVKEDIQWMARRNGYKYSSIVGNILTFRKGIQCYEYTNCQPDPNCPHGGSGN